MKRLPMVLLTAGALIGTSLAVFGDGDNEHGIGVKNWWRKARLDVAPVHNTLYETECGSCHFAYQPGLLPARSWTGIMNRLDAHFGDNAELDTQTAAEITRYLTTNAADRSAYKRSKRFAASAEAQQPILRITDTRYFQRKHDEVPVGLIRQGGRSFSFAQCDRCHTRADTGSFDEHAIHIPGLGRWDD